MFAIWHFPTRWRPRPMFEIQFWPPAFDLNVLFKTLSLGTREDTAGFASCSLCATSLWWQNKGRGPKTTSWTDGNEAKIRIFWSGLNGILPMLMCTYICRGLKWMASEQPWSCQPSWRQAMGKPTSPAVCCLFPSGMHVFLRESSVKIGLS